ncbi:MAG: DUF664 domain-containing protein [Anaerolineae bacterium]|nr:DUF664 domain-containing protein [Anaerolineae bacterium]
MDRFFEDYLERLHDLHQDIEKAIDGLPPEALDWSPMNDTNSINVLVVHLTGAERYWIGDVAGQDPSDRNRDAEFEAKGLDAAALKHRLASSEAYARQLLAALSVNDLGQERLSPRSSRTFTVSWALLHAMEHTALHVGHIQMTRQWWEQRAQEDTKN